MLHLKPTPSLRVQFTLSLRAQHTPCFVVDKMKTRKDTIRDLKARINNTWNQPTDVFPDGGRCCLSTHFMDQAIPAAANVVRRAAYAEKARNLVNEESYSVPPAGMVLEIILKATHLLKKSELPPKLNPFLVRDPMWNVYSFGRFLQYPYRYLAILENDGAGDEDLSENALLKSEVLSALCIALASLSTKPSGDSPAPGNIYVPIACWIVISSDFLIGNRPLYRHHESPCASSPFHRGPATHYLQPSL